MIALLLRCAALLTVLSMLALGAILGQPRDDAAMRAFFTPQDCAAPCFLGIRPGVTREDEALAILRSQPWIDALQQNADSVTWVWNGKQPAFVSSFGNSFVLAQIDFRAGIVDTIRLTTTTTWAEFYFLFGAPNQAVIQTRSTPSAHYLIYDGAYFAPGFQVETSTHCPVSREATWQSTVFITWPVSDAVFSGQRRFFQGC